MKKRSGPGRKKALPARRVPLVCRGAVFLLLFDGCQMVGDRSAGECGVVRLEFENAVPEDGLDLADLFPEHVACGDFHRALHVQFDLRFCFAQEKFPVGGLFKNGPFLISEADPILRDVGDLKKLDGVRFRKRITGQRESRRSPEAVRVS